MARNWGNFRANVFWNGVVKAILRLFLGGIRVLILEVFISFSIRFLYGKVI